MLAEVKKSTLTALTGVRFWAALFVVFYHFAPSALRESSPNVSQFIACGPIAVGLFFVLSGFILTYSCLRKEVFSVPYRQFFSSRVARIYPVYFLAFLVTFPLFFLTGLREGFDISWFSTIFTQLTLTQAWSPDTAFSYNFPAWSLSAEAFFYLIFPFAAMKISGMASPKVILTAIFAWLAGMAFVIHYSIAANLFSQQGLDISLEYPRWLTVLKVHPLARVHEFIIGICIGFLFERGYRVPEMATWLAGLAIVTVACFSGSIPFAFLHNGIFDPLFAVLILGLASASHSLLSNPGMLLLGESSYALYIIHHPLWRWMSVLNHSTWNVKEDTLVFFALYLVLVIASSIAVFLLIEQPGRRLLQHWLNQPSQHRPMAGRIPATHSGL